MGVMPVHRLLLTMSGPMMLSMLIQALYNVVDSMFVSYISEAALTAVSLAYPMQNLMIAVATGTGVGINATLSKSLGEKNYEKANKAAANGVFLALCSFFPLPSDHLKSSVNAFQIQIQKPVPLGLRETFLTFQLLKTLLFLLTVLLCLLHFGRLFILLSLQLIHFPLFL